MNIFWKSSLWKSSLLAVASLAISSSALANGASTFSDNCSVCHVTGAKDSPTVGPNLNSVVGRQAGSQKAFDGYSSAMKSFGKVWTVDLLTQYINNPGKIVPGNHMPFDGLKNIDLAKSVATWLSTQH